MTTLREAAQQALEALEMHVPQYLKDRGYPPITALRAALAEPVQEPGDFDHAIGADRFKVVRGAFWWHVLIGDSPTEHGKFHSRASAEKMAADLLREFRNGAFVQHEAALAESVQEPVASIYITPEGEREFDDWRCDLPVGRTELYAAPPQRKPLTEEEILRIKGQFRGTLDVQFVDFARAIERAHGIG